MAEAIDIRELNIRIEQKSGFVTNLVTGMNQVIVGQQHLIDSLLIGLLSDGHILLEGVPGLAKTLAIKTLSQLINAKYSRIQFTPDLLPADVVGTQIYSQKEEKFLVKKGPVFANFVLADEINRAPAKVQSALLEANARTPSNYWRRNLQFAKSIYGNGNAKPYRTRRNIYASRSSGRPFYVESSNRLSNNRRGKAHYSRES